jgi:REP element-mobilizing transposase RayT
MARKPRVEYAGAFYHVIVRGNQRQIIFRGDTDRRYYLERLEEYRQRYGFKVYAYVLMSNHVHMLVETGKVPLSKIMCVFRSIRPVIPVETGRLIRSKAAGGSRSEATLEFFLIA